MMPLPYTHPTLAHEAATVAPKPTRIALEFMRDNDMAQVISANVKGQGGAGGIFYLANRRRYDLSREDCASLPRGYPKWKFT